MGKIWHSFVDQKMLWSAVAAALIVAAIFAAVGAFTTLLTGQHSVGPIPGPLVPFVAFLAAFVASWLLLRIGVPLLPRTDPGVSPTAAVTVAAPIEYENAKFNSSELKKIVPLIRYYRATHSLLGELALFAEDMEKIPPSGDIHADTEKIHRASQANSKKFHDDFRYRLISLTTDLKSKWGLVHPNLTDSRLVNDVYGPLGVEPLLDGLRYLMDELQKLLADEASNLDVRE